jgi:hypothetical protein
VLSFFNGFTINSLLQLVTQEREQTANAAAKSSIAALEQMAASLRREVADLSHVSSQLRTSEQDRDVLARYVLEKCDRAKMGLLTAIGWFSYQQN